MTNVLKTYLLSFSGIVFVFGGFVACGTEMYKVSMKDDYHPASASGAESQRSSEDKSSPLYGIHAPSGWKKIPIPFRFSPELNNEQKIHLMAAMERWEWATGKHLFSYEGEHQGVSGDSFKELYSSLDDGINGNYLDNDWAKTKKPDYVLATTIWNNTSNDFSMIATADIHFNNQYYVIGDSLLQKATPEREVVDMQSLALHELGHLLGLSHVDEDIDALSIMNPSLFIGEGLTSRKFSKSDIERIQKIYGCAGEACDIDNLVAKLESDNGDQYLLAAQKWLEAKGTAPAY